MNLSKAFAPHNLADFSDIEITPKFFSVKICQMVTHSQHYQKRLLDFGTTHPQHPSRSEDHNTRNKFLTDIVTGEVNKETTEFLAHVIIADWTLIGDGNKKVPFHPVKAVDAFTNEAGGRIIAHKLLLACRQESQFLEADLKN